MVVTAAYIYRYLRLCAVMLLLQACHPSYHITQHTRRVYTVGQDAGADSALIRMLQPYKTRLDAAVQTVIGYTDTTLTKDQPECTLGNFLADAVLAAAGKAGYQADAAIINYGSLRLPYINPGPLTTGKIFELMPFDNQLIIAEIPGSELRRFCTAIAAYGGWPVSGIRFVIRDKQAEDIQVNGRPLDDRKLYHVAVNDYMAKGGDNCTLLVPLPQQLTTVVVRDAMISYIAELAQAQRPLHPVLENRIRYAE